MSFRDVQQQETLEVEVKQRKYQRGNTPKIAAIATNI